MARGLYVDVRTDAMGTDPGTGVQPPDPEKPQALAQPTGASAVQGQGPLFEMDDKAVFKAIDQIVERQEPLAKNREAARKHRARVRRGIPFSTLKKDEDRAVWTAELPPGVSDTPAPIPNTSDDLCRKIVSQIIVDLPQPNPKPATDSEQDRDSSDVAKQFLRVDGDESGTNDSALYRDCLDSAMTDASEFTLDWVEMQGGGWRPLQIMAHPMATDPAHPLDATQPVIDPMTGQPMMDMATGQPQQQPAPPADPVLRYVTEGNQFTENPAEAARQWMPKHRTMVLGPQHVRTLPATADVWTASAVVLLLCQPLSILKAMVPEVAAWDDDQLRTLTEWKPRREKVLVPESMRSRLKEQKTQLEKGDLSDDTLVFWYHKFCRIGGLYPDGAEIAVSGAQGGIVLKKRTLRNDITRDEGTHVLLRDVPVSQCRAMLDSEGKDPFGRCPIDLFGQTGEGLAHLFGAVYEDTDKRLHPNVFTASTSPVQDWQMNDRSGKSIPVYSKDDMPMYEEFADLASFLPDVMKMLRSDMEDAAGLGSAAQMLNTPDAVSGKAKEMELTQAKVALTPIAQGFFAFVKRRWRIKLQLAQAYLTLPQQIEYSGVDAAYKQRWWTGADFAGVKDVAIQAGSGTMMSPAEKQQYVMLGQSQMWFDEDEAREVGRSTMADDVGVGAAPFEDSIKRELAQWNQGMPDGWQPAQPQMDPTTGQPMMDPATQQPMMGAPTSTPFTVRPADEDPMVAKRQYKVLRDFTYTSDYTRHQPEWRALLDQRLAQAMYAAGIQTVKQQAEAAAQQAQAAQQDKESDREFKRSEGDANRAAKAQPRMAA